MIRNTMFGLSLLALSGATAFAAPMVKHQARTQVVAQAPAADAPKDGAKAEKKAKHAKKAKGDATKGEAKTDATKPEAPATK